MSEIKLGDVTVTRVEEMHGPIMPTGALFPTLDNVYDGFFVDLEPGQAIRLHGQAPSARFWSLVFYDRWFNTPDFSVHRWLPHRERRRDGTRRHLPGDPRAGSFRPPQLDRHRRSSAGHPRAALPFARGPPASGRDRRR